SAPSGDEAADAASARVDEASPNRAPTAAAVVLSLSALVAAFGFLSPLAHWVTSPDVLPPPLPTEHQDAESLAFLVSFVVALPLAALLVPPALDRASARLGRDAASEAALGLTIALSGLLIAVKLAERIGSASHPALLLVASAAWWVL